MTNYSLTTITINGIPQLLPHPFFTLICHRSSMPCTYIAIIILHSQYSFMHTYIQPDVTTNFLPKFWLENSPGQVKPYVYPSGFLFILVVLVTWQLVCISSCSCLPLGEWPVWTVSSGLMMSPSHGLLQAANNYRHLCLQLASSVYPMWTNTTKNNILTMRLYNLWCYPLRGLSQFQSTWRRQVSSLYPLQYGLPIWDLAEW